MIILYYDLHFYNELRNFIFLIDKFFKHYFINDTTSLHSQYLSNAFEELCIYSTSSVTLIQVMFYYHTL